MLYKVSAQFVAAIIIILPAIGAQSENQKRFLFYQVIINALYVLHYALLSSATAVVISVICVIRTLIFYII